MTFRLTEDFTTDTWGRQTVVPKGTKLARVKWGERHGERSGYVVDSITLLQELTGNMHDPKYRYVWVPSHLVEEVD